MLKFEFTYNGKPFNEDDFIDDVIKHTIEMAKQNIEEKLRNVTCPDHKNHLEKL